MGISINRLTWALLAFALVAGACGGGDVAAVDTTRRPITTTLPPEDIGSTTIPTTSDAPRTSDAPTTTVLEPIPESIGGIDDSNVASVPAGAARFFYAGSDAASSLRSNSLGHDQVLYYDVYQPAAPNGLTALYLHDGAIDSGYANDDVSQATCNQLIQLGVWCVSIEYRRGFAGFSTLPTAATEISTTQGERYQVALRDARNDSLEAWFHLNAAAESIGLPTRYVIVGEGAGALMASDIALTTSGLPYDIAGAIVMSGSHEAGKPLIGTPTFPVILQTGLLDGAYPAYLGRIYLDDDMPFIIGARALYDQLAEIGAVVRLYLNAQDGNGLGGYRNGGQISFLPAVIQLMLNPDPSGVAVEYRFRCDDANFGAAAPGVVINSATLPDFRYEPYESDLESGLSPDEALQLHPLETTTCQ